jgi:heterodisulfide reductase subunit B
MAYALFKGCTSPALVPQYEIAAGLTLEALGVELADDLPFGCCGYPMRNIHRLSFLVSAARNLALAGQRGLDMLVLCMCCYGTLQKAAQFLREEPEAREAVARCLDKEGLHLNIDVGIRHLLSVYRHDVGLETIRSRVRIPLSAGRLAPHYGCHALRPSDIVAFDDPYNPRIMEELLQAVGVEPVDWEMRLECCGAPVRGINEELSRRIGHKKIQNAVNAGAHCLCTACPYCQLQFDHAGQGPGSVLYSQVLGLAFGFSAEAMGFGEHETVLDPNAWIQKSEVGDE